MENRVRSAQLILHPLRHGNERARVRLCVLWKSSAAKDSGGKKQQRLDRWREAFGLDCAILDCTILLKRFNNLGYASVTCPDTLPYIEVEGFWEFSQEYISTYRSQPFNIQSRPALHVNGPAVS
ncbi:uncharacterized protein LOC113004002 [Solenopsis invicta]|uniref:uncharacterized protein LOC113004002 n=1 Tax=Solenopsis invicta TaxID=13686 RepID=UPI00193DBF8F|nr:uncharacterized protein LOC113004002 [Solenopsis invicta]